MCSGGKIRLNVTGENSISNNAATGEATVYYDGPRSGVYAPLREGDENGGRSAGRNKRRPPRLRLCYLCVYSVCSRRAGLLTWPPLRAVGKNNKNAT